MSKIPLLLLALLPILPATAQTAPNRPRTSRVSRVLGRPPVRPAPVAAVPVLIFQRTTCYGTCPAYRAQVFADGRVAYEGQAHVPVLGKKTLRLPANVVAEMLRQAREIRFSTLQTQYSRGATDIPSTIVTVHAAGQAPKTITVEDGAPEELQGYLAYLRSQLDPLAGLKE